MVALTMTTAAGSSTRRARREARVVGRLVGNPRDGVVRRWPCLITEEDVREGPAVVGQARRENVASVVAGEAPWGEAQRGEARRSVSAREGASNGRRARACQLRMMDLEREMASLGRGVGRNGKGHGGMTAWIGDGGPQLAAVA